MEEIEIPQGAMAFLEGVFYKISNGRVFYHGTGGWVTSTKTEREIKEHLRTHPDLVASVFNTVREWVKPNNRKDK